MTLLPSAHEYINKYQVCFYKTNDEAFSSLGGKRALCGDEMQLGFSYQGGRVYLGVRESSGQPGGGMDPALVGKVHLQLWRTQRSMLASELLTT